MKMECAQRLWIVSELFPPDETSTSYIVGEIANTMSHKYRVGVICGPEVYDKGKNFDENNKFILDPAIELYRTKSINYDKNTLRGKALSFLLTSERLIVLVKRKIQKGDKVLMVTNPAPMVVLMSKLKKKVNFELNILVHDVFPENTKPAGIRLPMYNIVKRVFDRAYSRADQLIVLGRDMAEVLKSKVSDATVPPTIKIIENWGDIDGIRPQPFPDGKVILQYAGNVGRVQGIEKVIQSLADEVEFHVYGTGAMVGPLKKMSRPNVFFHGPYLRSQQNEILAACDIALVTLQDGMYGLGVPSKTYNIMASGRPILFLGPKNSEIDLLIRENEIGYCQWPERWDKDELIRMGLRARELVVARYSKKTILDKFLSAV